VPLRGGRANKADPRGTFAKLWRAAERGEGPWKALFQPWSARPDRTPAWYEEQRQDSLMRTGGLDVLWEQYPETPDQALAAATLTKRLPLQWVEACSEDCDPVEPDLGLPGLTCWEHPGPGKRYVIGADPAEGIPHRDPSAACVLEKETLTQVAELAGTIEPAVFGQYLAQLAGYYNKAAVLIERNNHGHLTINAAREEGCHLLKGHDKNPGWLELNSTKCDLWDNVAEHLRVGAMLVRSGTTRTQLISIEGATLKAPEGEHDDHAVAFALAVQAACTPTVNYAELHRLLRR
jgi:hypothetical protein